MEIISLKSYARKPLPKQKCFYTNRDSFIGTLSRMSVFTDFFINAIVFMYIFLLFYGILTILVLKFKVKVKVIGKTQQLLIHAWSTVEK